MAAAWPIAGEPRREAHGTWPCHRTDRRGRDFVVGDLHGHRVLLEDHLHVLAFDDRRDRLFSVGDLVDRGPDSPGTLALREEPGFHAVAGHHELMLLHHLGRCGSRRFDRRTLDQGPGAWVPPIGSPGRAEILRLADRVAALPMAIRVDEPVAFHVLHGDAVPLETAPQALVARPAIRIDRAEAVTTSRRNLAAVASARWSTRVFDGQPVRLSDQPFTALPPSYVGHTRTPCITVHASHVYLEHGVGRRDLDGRPRPPTVVEHRVFTAWLSGSLGPARSESAAAGDPAAA